MSPTSPPEPSAARSPGRDLRVLLALLRGQPRGGQHAERLEAFYGPQADRYDDFRERLLHGREALIRLLDPAPGATVIELGGGTGRNVLFFGEWLDGLGRVEVVDLCRPLLAQARRRFADRPNVQVTEADACSYRPAQPADVLYFSYALTMIPDWQPAIDNGLAMLRPGGVFGAVDFYVSGAKPPPGLAKHGLLMRAFWPRWFAHDGVRLDAERLAYLRARLPDHRLEERLAPVPYLPGARVPYYLFVARKP